MKILWVTYAPLGRAAELIENQKSQSGTWVDATARELIEVPRVELLIACIASRNVKIYDEESGITFCGLAGINNACGCMPDKSDKEKWKEVIEDFKPEIIMVWGTEYSNGISVLEAAGDIPTLFFVQGVLGRIVNYPFGLVPKGEVFRNVGPFAMLKFGHFYSTLRKQRKQKKYEKEMVKRARGVINDNQWADSYYRMLVSGIKTYRFPLPINKKFIENKYNISEIAEHSIFTIDGCNPAKGMFHLIKALKMVKEYYPDVHLYIPGRVPNKKPRIIFESPYFTYLKKLVKRLELEQNVTFCGQLTSEQMKEHILSCHAFVMPSCIENHSSSLREAMYLGAPCVTTMVGSVDEFTSYGYNVLTYRYEEEDVLADCILRIFENKEFAQQLGDNAYHSIRKKYPQDHFGQQLIKIYEEVINE